MSKTTIITTKQYFKKGNFYQGNYRYFYDSLSNGDMKFTLIYTTKNNAKNKLQKNITIFKLHKANKKGVMFWSLWSNGSVFSKDGISSHKQIKYVYHQTIDNIRNMINNMKDKSELEDIFERIKEDFERTDYWNC